MKKHLKRIVAAAVTLCAVLTAFTACGSAKKKVVIYTSMEDYRIEYMQKRLDGQFPDYKITVEYKSSGEHAATLKAAGTNTDCDITYNLEYTYIKELADMGVLANLEGISDFSVYDETLVESTYYLPQERNGGSVILNMDIIESKGLDVPSSYADLLDPQYKGLISMPSPASSGTGYMFLLSLVNTWGEDEAFEYFDKLSDNILSYTSSGSGPVNALIGGEAAIGLGMTAQAVTKLNDGANLKLVSFEEGTPYSVYGQAVIAGKEENEAVMEVFEYLSTELTEANNEIYFPEKLYADKSVSLENYPTDVKYADMSGNTPERKDALLAKWKY